MDYILKQKHDCPKCKKGPLDGATSTTPDPRSPRKNDYTICAYCVTLLQYIDNDLNLEIVSEEEIQKFKDEGAWEEVEKIMAAIRYRMAWSRYMSN